MAVAAALSVFSLDQILSGLYIVYIHYAQCTQSIDQEDVLDSLRIENLCKTYPAFHLDNVSFSLEEGYIMGFIGRNGAGKTTTLKTMMRFVHPDSGSVYVNGINIEDDEFAVKNLIGFVSGTDGFYTSTTLKKLTSVTRTFYSSWDEEKYQSLLKKFNLDENKKIRQLSAGMKVKYQIAVAMSHGAKLLILDEPTSGLDPVSRDEMVGLFQDYIADGEHSILFSTHITSDLEKCADFITYIKNGRIITSTDKDSFQEDYLLVSGTKEALTEERRAKAIGLRTHRLGFEAMIKATDRGIFSGEKLEISKPTLEEIMVHIERNENKAQEESEE